MGLGIKGAGGQGVTGSGTVDQIPIWVGTSQLGNSVLRQVGAAVIVGATDPAPAATETLRTIDGLISDTGAGHDNLIAGRAATAAAVANGRNVVLGTEAAADAASSGAAINAVNNVVIGFQSQVRHGVGGCTIIGAGLVMGPNFPASTTVIGSQNTFNNSFSGPGVGIGSSWQGAGCGFGNQQSTGAVNNWAIVGRSAQANADGSTVVGDNARGNHANSVTLGRNTLSIGANSLTIGAQNVGIATVLIGEGDTLAAYAGITYRHTNGSGTDDVGGNATWIAPRGTGAAVGGGRLIYQTGTVAASSAVLQVAQTRLEIREALANDAAVNFVVADAAGAGAGTLTNAPHAGDPDVFVGILHNGVRVAVPGWIY